MEKDWSKILINIKRRGKKRIIFKNFLKSLPLIILLFFFSFVFISRNNRETYMAKEVSSNNEIKSDVKMIIITHFFYDDDFGFFVDK